MMRLNIKMKRVMAKLTGHCFAALLLINSSCLLAHNYFEGFVDLQINSHKNRLEIVHRYTTHDLEIVLTKKYAKKITADQDDFNFYLKKYINDQFYLVKNKHKIELEWVGNENGISETSIYQMNSSSRNLSGMILHNQVLTDFFSHQVNRVNYKDSEIRGTLIFTTNTFELLLPASNDTP